MSQDTTKLRVRIGRRYNNHFHTDIGQANAELVRGPMTPLWRVSSYGDAVAFVGPGYDLIHTLGSVPLFTRAPYIITFEDYLPRLPDDRRNPVLEAWLRRKLVQDRCRAILPKSQYGVRQFLKQHQGFADLPKLLEKMELLYPGVEIRRSEPKRKSPGLKLLFVGNDFMRKGLPAVSRAHRQLRRQGIPVETTAVTSLQWSPKDYIGPPDARLVEAEIRDLDQDGIEILKNVPNRRVRELMDQTDYLIFPTFHDTFGFVSIEALASGTPVIATDTCAQPEIVIDGETGWLLPFENDSEVGKWTWIYRQREPGYVEAYAAQVEALGKSIAERLESCWQDRDAYERLSSGALRHARDRFDIEKIRRRTEQIYDKCRQSE